MQNKEYSLEELKKNLDFGVYGEFKMNTSGQYLLVGQKKILIYEKGKKSKIILYSDIEFLEIIEVFSGGGIEFGLIPTRSNSVILGNDVKIKLVEDEVIINLDIDNDKVLEENKEIIKKIKELFLRFSPDTEIRYNCDPYFL